MLSAALAAGLFALRQHLSAGRLAGLIIALSLLAVVAGCAGGHTADPWGRPSAGADSLVRPARPAPAGSTAAGGTNASPRADAGTFGSVSRGPAEASAPETIRVRLVEWAGQRQLLLGVTSAVRIYAGEQRQPIVLELPAEPFEVRALANGGGIQVGRQVVRADAITFEPAGDTRETPAFQLATGSAERPTPVRGSLTLRVTRGGHLEPIATLDFDTYVAGSLLAEMPASFGEAALEAQAVAIRTFALYQVIANRNRGDTQRPYDVQSSVADLRYGGVPYEQPISHRVAATTRGLVLTYQGRLFPAFFHSTSGGSTIASAAYFNSFADFPPLRGGIPSPSDASPLHTWRTELAWPDVRAKLLAEGAPANELGEKLVDVRRLFAASVGEPPARGVVDPARRPHSFAFVTDAGTYRIPAPRLRAILGSGRDTMPSTCCTVQVVGQRLVLRGHGFGHGVGLCQYGAAALGQRGATYAQILAHYYPESEISRRP